MERAQLARLLGAKQVGARSGPRVVLEANAEAFMRAFAEAVEGRDDIFLADATWGEHERTALQRVIEANAPRNATHDGGERGWLMIPSGGTSGRLKFARHDTETIAAAVRGFMAHFALERVNSVGVLPLYHVSGFMAWMRCVMTGGVFLPWDWKRVEGGDLPVCREPGPWVISLVPTQLQRLLTQPAAVAWLRRFDVVFVGGGPTWAELADQAAEQRLRVSLGYGMTETAAMVTALRPPEFAAGHRSSGSALPHAHVEIDPDGRICVGGASLFRGYYPEFATAQRFETEDLGEWDRSGHLRVLGRRDAVIISGGKKVQPNEVEATLRSTGEFQDVVVIGVPDPEWGEVVVACYPAAGKVPDVAGALERMVPWQRPKRLVAMAHWPCNAQGKVNRTALREHLVNRPGA